MGNQLKKKNQTRKELILKISRQSSPWAEGEHGSSPALSKYWISLEKTQLLQAQEIIYKTKVTLFFIEESESCSEKD